jgi:aminoglycoside phosphotransferase (APT) family kinase protein
MLSGHETHAVQDAAAAGSVLAALHSSELDGLRVFSATDQLKVAALAADSAAAVVPELDGRLQSLLRMLELARPDLDRVVTVHGNLHPRQLIRLDGSLALTDLDHARTAPAALDLASYAADLVNGDEEDELSTAAAALEGLIEGYGSRPRGIAWYLATAIVVRTPLPFHFLKPNWPARTETMIRAAEGALHL